MIGDSGRGSPPQHEIAAQMTAFRQDFPFAFVLMLGDNIYEGPATREDYRRKFEEPYRRLLDEGVKFYAVLGNHDDPRQVVYPLFNMDGERYYSFSPPEDLLAKIATRVEFFALDSTNLDRDAAPLAGRTPGQVRRGVESVLLSPSALYLGTLSRVVARVPSDPRTAARQARR